ncbi:Rpn family recombination-promoting nuclease/putative transposase [Limosilactobacillus sp.]|jgi:predicted transposase/invertase (TIGR01784 family)|uniref:Rpn family recombination-promoting nuclease/putative transposase n=1 Tax=Limosilactobacillus sp. TaxID=2773925 RepID=UPI0025C524FC|nr:Rpn family recombination-promoting nuclease/putative transposase [Limosilactobacillus sp.]MCH3922964.1 Rpn family recombination-promoting nuclease/putative transposase [Limosilactobacillus sp.]MCH3927647.1 Rpn family recombination-promoting nuclease/putative transposase [Limosilactobacillus sp.]
MAKSTTDYKDAIVKWKNLTLLDDRMFGMVMQDDQLCLALLQRIFPQLGIKQVKKIPLPNIADDVRDSGGPHYDVYVRDDQKRTFILESFSAEKSNYPLEARMRYYLSTMDPDMQNLCEANSEPHIHPLYIVFFCDFDYFGNNSPVYKFELRCIEDPSLLAGDENHFRFFNAQATNLSDHPELKGLFKLMHNQTQPGDALAEQIIQKMAQIKQDPERRQQFMKYEADLADAERKGKEIGLEKGIRLATKMLINLQLNDGIIIRQLMETYDISGTDAHHHLEEARK